MIASLVDRAASLLGSTLRHAETIGGGDLSDVIGIELEDGRRAVVKSCSATVVEAEMLEAIRATGAPAPDVLANDDRVLVLERLPADGRLDDAWRHLGTVLAKLHATVGDPEPDVDRRYGWATDYAFGRVNIENAWSDSWARFWAERRLANQVGYLPPSLARCVEALAADIGNRLPAQPPASLLHGDLWGGNVLVSGDKVTGLIDPACYYGDCEVDFAMLGLFNHPAPELLVEYGSLAPGHEERLPIYQLWPAIAHFRLFGSGYTSMVERLLAAAGV